MIGSARVASASRPLALRSTICWTSSMSWRLTPAISRQAGSMSRGTAMSISSSGRAVARRHHLRELVALDDVVRASWSRRRRCRPPPAARAAPRSGPRCRRSAGRARSRGRSGGWRRRRCATPRATSARATSSAVSPAPTTSTRRSARSPSVRRASSTATEGIETPFSLIRGLLAGAAAGGEGAAEEAVEDRPGARPRPAPARRRV